MKRFLIVSLMLSMPAFLSASEEAKLKTSPRKNILRISSDKISRLNESPKKPSEGRAGSSREVSPRDGLDHSFPFDGPLTRVGNGWRLAER